MEYSNERQYIAEQEALKEQGEQQYNDELYAKEMGAKKCTDWQIPIDGKLVGKKDLITAWRFYVNHQIRRGDTSCPLCGSKFVDNDLFVCDECGRLCHEHHRCYDHYGETVHICKDCCGTCSEKMKEQDAYNAMIEEVLRRA